MEQNRTTWYNGVKKHISSFRPLLENARAQQKEKNRNWLWKIDDKMVFTHVYAFQCGKNTTSHHSHSSKRW